MRALFSARAALIVVVSLAAGAGLLVFAAQSGGTLEHPVGFRVWEIGFIIAALAVLGVGVAQSVKERRLSRLLLVAVASSSAFWQETYGDWASYVLYSDRFWTFTWGDTAFTGPVRCWWFIAGYVIFYGLLFVQMEVVVNYVRKRWPTRNPYILAAAVSFPVFYVFDLILEGFATGLGLWHYTHILWGPGLTVGHGAFPLVWPIVEQVPFIALVAFAMMWRSAEGEDVFELTARVVLRRKPGQLAILVSWVVLFNVAFLTTTILPQMLARLLFGPASELVP
ncbi:spirocyclase AveC family protein [Mycobacterium sp. NBC_00419]|uniref:spirocyclase AveC family protein n=1 Tax=Mycobacterium sp. NBC_00419 TaxID=2975989 RepID=UPI002E1DA9D5